MGHVMVKALTVSSLVALLLAGCDPTLTPQVVPGEGGTDGATPGPPPANGDGGPSIAPSDASPDGTSTGDSASDGSPPDDGSLQDAPIAPTDGSGGPKHSLDGTNDFTADQTLPTSSAGYTGYIDWDADRVYFGMGGRDIASGDGTKWVLIYLGGTPGATNSLPYGAGLGLQQSTLPLQAKYHLRWKADNQYTNAQVWDSGTSAWKDAAFKPSAVQKGQFVKLFVPRNAIDDPAKLQVHMTMLIEAAGNEWTYAGVPSTSFADGKNPKYTKYFEFDLAATNTPASYSPLP